VIGFFIWYVLRVRNPDPRVGGENCQSAV